MNIKLVAAVMAITGLAACSPDVTPESSSTASAPTASSAPAKPVDEQQTGQPDKPAAATTADEEKKAE